MVQLDATAGFRLMWNGKDIRDVIFIDRRALCRPTIVADSRALPIRDHSIDRVICDPPHWFRKNADKSADRSLQKQGLSMYDRHESLITHDRHDVAPIARFIYRYGHWNNKTEWVSFAYRTNQEFHRVLSQDGNLLYKICLMGSTPHVTRDSVKFHYTNFNLRVWTVQPSKGHCQRSKSETVWLTMVPKEVI